MTFNFDLNDYQDSQYKSEFLAIADQLFTKNLTDLTENEIVDTLDGMVKAAKNQDKFVKQLTKYAKQKRNSVKLASAIIQANGNNTNGIEELTEEFYNGEFDNFVL